jgi:hypothetical protein
LEAERARQNVSVARDTETALRNELLFREANDKIAERRDELDAVQGLTPFLCECEDENCTAIVRLSTDDYSRVRAGDATFVVVPGHPTIGAETEHRGDGWVCVTKAGRL